MSNSKISEYQVRAWIRDIRAIRKGRIKERIWNRFVAKVLGAIGRKLYK